MGQVSIHEDHKVASAFAETVNVGTTKTKFTWSGMELDLIDAIDFLQVLDNILSSIRRVIVDDHNFHVDFTAREL